MRYNWHLNPSPKGEENISQNRYQHQKLVSHSCRQWRPRTSPALSQDMGCLQSCYIQSNGSYQISCESTVSTPWSRLLKKLILPELIKKSHKFCGTQKFISMFTRPCHWSLFWARWIHFTSIVFKMYFSIILLTLPSSSKQSLQELPP